MSDTDSIGAAQNAVIEVHPWVGMDDTACPPGIGNAFSPIVPFDFREPGGRDVNGLLPGNALPSAAAPFTGSLEWVLESIGAIQILFGSAAFFADAALIQGSLRVSYKLDQFSPFDVRKEGASAMTEETGSSNDLPVGAHYRMPPTRASQRCQKGIQFKTLCCRQGGTGLILIIQTRRGFSLWYVFHLSLFD